MASPTVSARAEQAKRLFAPLPPTYDQMGTLLSFGQDPRWRRFLVSRLHPPGGGRVLDVATGTAAVAIEVLARHLDVEVVGLDQSEQMLREGVRRTAAAGLRERAAFVLGTGEHLPFADRSFDAVSFTYLLRYVDDPAATVAELARVLRPGGSMASLEFYVPRPPWHLAWWLHVHGLMPLIGRMAPKGWHDVARFLGPSIDGFVARHPLDDQLLWWRAAGMEGVRARRMTFGSAVVIWGTKRGS